MELSIKNVRETFLNCLFNQGEATDDYVEGHGAILRVRFHPGRLKAAEPDIISMLDQLPDDFKKEKGGGQSFLNMCLNSSGVQWADEHSTVDQLVTLGLAVGGVCFLMPRDMWPSLPGSMPYVAVTSKPITPSNITKTLHHTSGSISGLLKLSDDELGKMFDNDPKATRFDLETRHENGAKFIPSEGCDNFHAKIGCLGHGEGVTAKVWANSSNLKEASFHPENSKMVIQFLNGNVYEYYDVPSVVWNEFITAPSGGSYLSKNIAKVFKSSKIV